MFDLAPLNQYADTPLAQSPGTLVYQAVVSNDPSTLLSFKFCSAFNINDSNIFAAVTNNLVDVTSLGGGPERPGHGI
jgi:hypothetical protein